ncbi:MAG: flagellar export chaperone FliS [Chthoniobacteraceae bacterium]
MPIAQVARSYQTAAVKTASPGQLVLMLFDGALRAMATAHKGFEIEAIGPRFEQVNNQLIKAQAILRELQSSLDLKLGGEFAQRMWALYDFMLDRLGTANVTKDPEPIRIVEQLLGEVRDAWATMLAANQKEAR